MHLLTFKYEFAKAKWLQSQDHRICEARLVSITLPEKQKGDPNLVMLVVAADIARDKWRVATMDPQPDMQPAYDSADDQDHGSPPPKEQQT